jgi:hypothetical protein
MVVKHKFLDVDLLFSEIGGIVNHYRNEMIYKTHTILFNGSHYIAKFDLHKD